MVTDYHVRLLLEALCSSYSLETLSEGKSLVRLLHSNLKLSLDEAESIVEGALQLKAARQQVSIPTTYLQ